ncbi:MAG: DUF3048 domain-containing protein [Roseburia sp.]|nr:DUF3048 domain-containing protein [Roseburia sp.]
MRKIKIGMLLFASVWLLAACSGNPFSSDSDPEPTEDASAVQSSEPSEAPSELPEDGLDSKLPSPYEGMARSPLTNEWIDEEKAKIRPIAVMTPNESNALPQYALSQASVLYEAPVEGFMSRLLAIYEDWQDLEKIGNIRSLRTYYTYWAFEWDAFIIHCGHPFYVDDLIALPDTQTINEANYVDSIAFYRDESRPMPHNAFATGQGILDAIGKKGYSLEYRGLADQPHFTFAEDSSPNTLRQYGDSAQTAVYIDLSGCYPLTRCYFDYNEAEGLYYRYQHLSGGPDGPHTDASGQQLAFQNILVQYVKAEDLGGGYYAFQCSDDTEDGWFFTRGLGIHVTWKKSDDYGATKFYDDLGNEIELNTGKTMICVAIKGDKFTFR